MGHCSRVAVRCILFEIKVITANVNVPAGIKNTSKLHVKREGHYIYIYMKLGLNRDFNIAYYIVRY